MLLEGSDDIDLNFDITSDGISPLILAASIGE